VEIEQPEQLKTMVTQLVEELQAHYLFSLSPLKNFLGFFTSHFYS